MKRSPEWEWWLLFGLLAVLAYTGGSAIQEVAVQASQSIIDRIAHWIGVAEGFFVPGTRPARNHNPGDLTRDITGTGTGQDSAGFVIYSTDADGWAALKHLVSLMFEGSHIYNADMTIAEIASRYTETDQDAWANTVASGLGVDVNTPLRDIAA